MTTTKKITFATVKSFVKKNTGNVYINLKSKFSGMSDGLEYYNAGFLKVDNKADHVKNTLGISGAWFVGCSRDRFTSFENETLIGIKVSNSCGSFILAIKK